MDDTLFRAYPPQLAVGHEVAPCLAPAADERRERLASKTLGDVVDGCADNVVAAPDGKRLKVAIERP